VTDLIRLRAANLLVNLARFDAAREIVDSVSDEETNPVWRAAADHLSGMSAWAAGDLAAAERLLQSAVAKVPSDALYVGRLIAFYAEYERLDEARALRVHIDQVGDAAVLRQYLELYGLSDGPAT
jgi:Flp pilus assembly protein TadD